MADGRKAKAAFWNTSEKGATESSKVRLLLDEERPKVDPSALRRAVNDAGLRVTAGKADAGIVVGGDGLFSRFGRTESEPLLFVGVKTKRADGSKAYMAHAYFDELPLALERLKSGDFKVEDHSRLEVFKNGKSLGEIFTDTYLQRGVESAAIRYRVEVTGSKVDITEFAIGDGIVITTASGSTGYYSYPDRIRNDVLNPGAYTKIGEALMGVCHIAPTYAERVGSSVSPIRYTVPWGSKVTLNLTRHAEAWLYGTGPRGHGVKISIRDKLSIVPGKRVTKVVSLPH